MTDISVCVNGRIRPNGVIIIIICNKINKINNSECDYNYKDYNSFKYKLLITILLKCVKLRKILLKISLHHHKKKIGPPITTIFFLVHYRKYHDAP